MGTIFRLFLFSVLSVCGIFGIEQILYRFSDGYAKARSDLFYDLSHKPSWSWIGSLRFDQWKPSPAHDGQANLPTRVRAESEYAKTSLSHTRAMRDQIYEHLLSNEGLPAEMPPLATHGKMEDIYLMEPVSETEVAGTILRILPAEATFADKASIFQHHRNLEKLFIPMLRKSFACGILHASSRDQLVSQVSTFGLRHKRLSRKILAWGEGASANLLAEVASSHPSLFTGLVLDGPLETFPFTPSSGPCILFMVGSTTSEPIVWNILDWMQILRKDSSGLATDRYRTLLTDNRTTSGSRQNYRSALACGYLSEIARLSSVESVFEGGVAQPKGALPAPARQKKPLGEENPNTIDKLPLIVETAEPLPLTPLDQTKLFDCKVVRDYRKIYTDPRFKALSNKDLIIILGKQFEDANALGRIRELDPQFVEFYEYFKAASPGL